MISWAIPAPPPVEQLAVHLAVHSPAWDPETLEQQVISIEQRVRELGGQPVRSEIRPYLAWMWLRVPDPELLRAGLPEGTRVHLETDEGTDWIADWVGPPRMSVWFDASAALRAGLWPAEALDRIEPCAQQAPGSYELRACFEAVAPGATMVAADPAPNDLIYAPHTEWGFEEEATFGWEAAHIVLRADREPEGGARHLRPARVFLPFPREPIIERLHPRPPPREWSGRAELGPECRELLVPRADPWQAERLMLDLWAQPGVRAAVPGQLAGQRVVAEVNAEEAARLGLPVELVRRTVEGPAPWSWRAQDHVVDITLGVPGDPAMELLRPKGEPLPLKGLVERRLLGTHAERLRVDGRPVQSVVLCPEPGTDADALARKVVSGPVSVGPVSAPLPWSPVPASGLAPEPAPPRPALPAAPQRLALRESESGCQVTLARSKRPRKATVVGTLGGACPSSWTLSGPADPDGALVLNADSRSWRLWPHLGRVQALTLPPGARAAWYTAGYHLVAFAEPADEGTCDVRIFLPDGVTRSLFVRTGLPAGAPCEDQLGIRTLQVPGGPEGATLHLGYEDPP